MFGRQLYSNAWAAISELVANGFDADATLVYLYIDMRNKSNAYIELLDNGSSMSENDIREKYVVIGRNRRIENPSDKSAGRKGIGKLAALYLSDSYQITTKQHGATRFWNVDVKNSNDTDTPQIVESESTNLNVVCKKEWESKDFISGTLIQLNQVDFHRIGDAAIDALRIRLSNYFLFDTMKQELKLCVIQKDTDIIEFTSVKKQIAFGNMASIFHSSELDMAQFAGDFTVSYRDKRGNDQNVVLGRELLKFPESVNQRNSKDTILLKGKGVFYGIEKEYSLVGWIGVHSSIDITSARRNDQSYTKNQFYNPNQIRVYVRNKLAAENIIDKLDLVGTYANYIEGEVSFEILDENDFEDIATSNRQDFSVTDERVQLLKLLLRGLCVQLIAKRQILADTLNDIKKKHDLAIQTAEKKEFTKQIREELLSIELGSNEVDTIAPIIANKLKGDYDLKTSYKIFISHSQKDRIFTDFISRFLVSRGFRCTNDSLTTDIFYSSDGLDITNLDPLSKTIKEMIVDNNTDILFFTSKNFLKSQYCLFEGGAAWATRAILDYSIISINYNSIPAFLTNGKPEFTFNIQDPASFELSENNYNILVTIINRLIKHLNSNRIVSGDRLVELVPVANFEDKVIMNAKGKTIRDYLDKDIVAYWDTYVLADLGKYIAEYNVVDTSN